MYRKLLLAVAAVSFLAAGCATIVDGKSQLVTFQSTPAGATVIIDGRELGVTPLSVSLEKKTGQVLVVRKEGFKDFSTPMATGVSGWFFGNILIGGLLGSTTDAASGAMHQYAPNQYLVTLEAEGGNSVTNEATKSQIDKVREFILLSYNPLTENLKAKSGSYLDSLLDQLGVASTNRGVAIEKIASLQNSYPDIAQFADQVIAAFMK